MPEGVFSKCIIFTVPQRVLRLLCSGITGGDGRSDQPGCLVAVAGVPARQSGHAAAWDVGGVSGSGWARLLRYFRR